MAELGNRKSPSKWCPGRPKNYLRVLVHLKKVVLVGISASVFILCLLEKMFVRQGILQAGTTVLSESKMSLLTLDLLQSPQIMCCTSHICSSITSKYYILHSLTVPQTLDEIASKIGCGSSINSPSTLSTRSYYATVH